MPRLVRMLSAGQAMFGALVIGLVSGFSLRVKKSLKLA